MAEENSIPEQITPTPITPQKSIEEKLDSQFTSDNLSSISYKGVQEKYGGSEKQKEIYTGALTDEQFKEYIESKYGSYELYKEEKNLNVDDDLFDPFTDYGVDVTVIGTDKIVYTSDHISPDEVIVQLLTGVCTFYYLKINGTSGKSVGSLKSDFIPYSNAKYRGNFFSPLSGDRIVLWDINKQSWNSFYMSRLIKFVRDETSNLQ